MTGNTRIRLCAVTLGFFKPALHRRLAALGIDITAFIFRPLPVAQWGRRPVSKRARRFAAWRGRDIVTLEDAFLRSIIPATGAPQGVMVDKKGVYYDANGESELIDRLMTYAPNDAEIAQAEALIARQIEAGLSKYNKVAPAPDFPHRDYVLVVDQARDDASIRYGDAGAADFQIMLDAARRDHPTRDILIKTHPHKAGYFSASDTDSRTYLITDDVNPWTLIQNADSLYAVTSQMGFEAILAGKRPQIFGRPFYAGWGLSDDRHPRAEPRGKTLTAAALYHVAMRDFPRWVDAAGRASHFEAAIDALHAEAKWQWHIGSDAKITDARAWKRPFLKSFLRHTRASRKAQIIRWGQKLSPDEWIIEDGFLRSRGLGASLVPPLSITVDKTGIYYDPGAPSDLETYIHQSARLGKQARQRARALRETVIAKKLSKYNLGGGARIDAPAGREVVLVAGQVADDKSLERGTTGTVKSNADLLKAVRADYPHAWIVYKPHPDVVAGLRHGHIDHSAADQVITHGDTVALFEHVDRVAVLTSQTGFEALLRGVPVTTYGMPFFADWGLTEDRAPATGRRGVARDLDALTHACLIDYPAYLDPKTNRITTPEIAVERLASGDVFHTLWLRVATRIQVGFYRITDYIGKPRPKKG